MAIQDDRPPEWWDKYKETEMYKTNEALSQGHRERLGLTLANGSTVTSRLLHEYEEDEVPKDMAGTLVSFRLRPGTTEKGFRVAWDRLVEESPGLDCLVPELEAPSHEDGDAAPTRPTIAQEVERLAIPVITQYIKDSTDALRFFPKSQEDWGPKGIHPHEADLDELPPSVNIVHKIVAAIKSRTDPAPEEADGPESPASQCPEGPSDRDTLRECCGLLTYSLFRSFDREAMDQFLVLVRHALPLLSQPSGPSRLWRALVEGFEELVQSDLSVSSSGPSLCPSGSPEEGTQTESGTPGPRPGPSRDRSRGGRPDSPCGTPEFDPSDGPSSGGLPARP